MPSKSLKPKLPQGMYFPENGQTYIPDPNDPLIADILNQPDNKIKPKLPDSEQVLTAEMANKLQKDFLTEDMKWKTQDIINKAMKEILFNVKHNLGSVEVSSLGYNSLEIKKHFEDLGYKLTRTDKRNDYPRYKIEW